MKRSRRGTHIRMADDSLEDQLPPEKPSRKIGLKGCAVALVGAALFSLLVGYLLRIWDRQGS